MDNQERFDAQEKQYFYSSDDIAKRNPIEGTVPYGHYKDDNTEFYHGKLSTGEFVDKVSNVISVDEKLLKRGQDRERL